MRQEGRQIGRDFRERPFPPVIAAEKKTIFWMLPTSVLNEFEKEKTKDYNCNFSEQKPESYILPGSTLTSFLYLVFSFNGGVIP